jgi:hypothetical protein
MDRSDPQRAGGAKTNSSLGKILWTLLLLPVVFYVIPIAFSFFDIKPATYGIYMGWLVGLLLLNAILPGSLPNMFVAN